mmetsp:Transcript_8206/g.15917  ORF Transcript_8206/g.15917 Transcript_8206/m.15917 type:complete len:138 (-) Transcript_8206:122-535(-)
MPGGGWLNCPTPAGGWPKIPAGGWLNCPMPGGGWLNCPMPGGGWLNWATPWGGPPALPGVWLDDPKGTGKPPWGITESVLFDSDFFGIVAAPPLAFARTKSRNITLDERLEEESLEDEAGGPKYGIELVANGTAEVA